MIIRSSVYKVLNIGLIITKLLIPFKVSIAKNSALIKKGSDDLNKK